MRTDKDIKHTDVRVSHLTPQLKRRYKFSNLPKKSADYVSKYGFKNSFSKLKKRLNRLRQIAVHYHLHYAFVILLLFLIVMQYCLVAINAARTNSPILGLHFGNKNITRYNRDKITGLVNDAINQAEHNPVQLLFKNFATPVTARQLGARYSNTAVVSAIYDTGRIGSLWSQLYTQDRSLFQLFDYRLGFPNINESLVSKYLKLVEDTFQVAPINANVTLVNNKPIVVPDQPGLLIDEQQTIKRLHSFDQSVDGNSLILPTQNTDAAISSNDVNKLLPQIARMVSQPLAVKAGTQTIAITPSELVSLIQIQKVPDPHHINQKIATVMLRQNAAAQLAASLVVKVSLNPQSNIIDGTKTIRAGHDGQMLDGLQTEVALYTNLLQRAQQIASAAQPLSLNLYAVRAVTLPKNPDPQLFEGKLSAYKNSQPAVIFSFDGVPNATYTPDILKVLKVHNIHGVFYLIGRNAQTYPDVVQKMVTDGNIVGISTYDYRDITTLSDHDLQTQITNTQKVVNSITGVTATIFRPPYNHLTDNKNSLFKTLNIQAMTGTVDALDWAAVSQSTIVKTVLSNSQPGSIITFHALNRNTADALPAIIKGLQQRGFAIN